MYRPFNKILFIICLSPLLFVSLYSMAQQVLISFGTPTHYAQSVSPTYSTFIATEIRKLNNRTPNFHTLDINRFKVEDFHACATNNQWSNDQIFEQYQLYKYPAFISFLRKHPEYLSRITLLYKDIRHYDWWDKLWAMAMGRYVPGLKNIIVQEMQCIAVLEKANKENQIRTNTEQHYRQVQDIIEINLTTNRNVLEELSHTWSEQESEIFHQRANALQLYLSGKDTYQNLYYYIPPETTQLFKSYPQFINELNGCYGNSIQQTLHKEFVDIVKEAKSAGIVSYIQHHLSQAIIVGIQANKAGFIKQASALSDFCWTLLDCSQAVGEGIILGCKNTVSMILHPIQTATTIINGFATVAHSMTHMMGIVDQLADYYVTDHDKFYLRTGEMADYVTDVIIHTVQQLQNTSRHNCIKEGAALITEAWLLQGMSKLVHSACTELVQSLPVILKEMEVAANVKQYAVIDMAGIKIPGAQLMSTKVSQAVTPYLKVANMNEFFNTDFGKFIRKYVEKTNMHIQGQSVYKVVQKFKHPILKKGDYIYLDGLHWDHLEVLKGIGKENIKAVINLNGTFNAQKTAMAKKTHLNIKF